jgi:hypothetical protein
MSPMENIIENAIVLQKSGEKQIYDAIQITKKGIITGRIKKNETHEVFEDQGFIPNSQIKKIIICTIEGKVKDIDY